MPQLIPGQLPEPSPIAILDKFGMMHRHSVICAESDCSCDRPPALQKTTTLWLTLLLVGGFALVEVGIGLSSHSLALLADSGHMLSDALALGISLLAVWLAKLPANSRATFGYRRVEILAALVNGVGLATIALWIGWEALTRLQQPTVEILSRPMLITGAVGLLVSSLNATLLHGHSHDDLNLRGAFLHMLADAVSALGVLGAAVLVAWQHWQWVDPAISLFVATLILLGTIPLIRQSIEILLEKLPPHLDLTAIQDHLQQFEGVVKVEQVRAWAIALDQVYLTAEIRVAVQEGSKRDRLLRDLQSSLKETFGIQETTLQLSSAAELLSLSESLPLANVPIQKL